MSGRIEGLNTTDFLQIKQLVESIGSLLDFNPANMITMDLSYNPNWLDVGELPTASLSSGSFKKGSLPSINWDKLTFDDGSLPSLTFPQLSFYGGKLPKIDGSPFIFGDPLFKFDLGKLSRIGETFGTAGRTGLTAYIYWKDPARAAMEEAIVALNTTISGGGVTYESGARDYAEWMERLDENEELIASDIVGVFGGRITRNTVGAEKVMVVSFKPIVLGNMPPAGEEHRYSKVAFLGQVPVKVWGTVKRGDYILPSSRNDGTGIAMDPYHMTAELFTRVVGRAWSEGRSRKLNVVNVAVGLHAGDIAEIVRSQEKRLATIQAKNAYLQERLDSLEDGQDEIRTIKKRLLRLENSVQQPVIATAAAGRH